jgi:predicted short-subunit dehydrogenase-like oxidoreductase (DUF2520 family)
MRELERSPAAETTVRAPSDVASVAVVGRGRMGRALAGALRDAGYSTPEPAGRDEVPRGVDAVVLAVPDAEIPAAAAVVAGAAPYVGHTSGATPLTALSAARAQAFGLHPLQTVTDRGADLRGAGCAVAGATPDALELARTLATRLGMSPFEVRDDQRAAYHGAASIASNYLVTLEWMARTLADRAGIEPPLAPLVRQTVANWAELGPHAALTGPIARADEATVAAQRDAIAAAAPELLAAFDALADRTRALAEEARRP